MAKKSTAVTKKESQEVAPDFMQGHSGQGTEALSSAALKPPRIKLMQSVSPELDENDDLKPGQFLHDSAEIILVSPIKIVPCFLTEAYFLFGPKQGDGLLARADDGVHWSPPDTEFEVNFKGGGSTVWKTKKTVMGSGLDKWGTFKPSDPKSPPAATHCINCVVMLDEFRELGPCVLSFTRSGLKTGKKFASNLKMANAPSFGRIFELTSVKVSGPEGDYYEPRLKPFGFIQDKEYFESCKSIYEAAKSQGVEVNVDRPGDESDDDDTNY